MASDRNQALNLCTAGNYDGSFVNTQQRNGPFRSGSVGTYLIGCRGVTYAPQSGQNAVPILGSNQIAYDWTRRVGDGTQAPQNADDCARLCGWMYLENQLGSPQNTSYACQSWEWTTSNTCNLYRDRNYDGTAKQLIQTTGKTAVVAAGGWASGAQQVNYVTSWKRSINPGQAVGRYVRDVQVEDEWEDWMKADLVLGMEAVW
ncbi:uncharacterized protein HMPREF1541_00408 [Cyphellophora europaea CBS 101466]|uniref:Uncharacterized protein n=1 Tax=Cyphellophora europaea (strain CBS 101466) TaxID=1220924 RepID=W2SE85_CYPE1|nr:uncharacterized protein HMPREF1541_00408 [Cyphellophora europaea CBS 101466]ETN46224.1 hypothetical protein HMPREF1541_00408 [Cyphellophora europaea CBS 101466]